MQLLTLLFLVPSVVLVLGVLIKIYLKFTTAVFKSKRRLDGKVAIVTGANTGIGYETAKDLARRGARVILACRDMQKAKVASDEIRRETRNRNVVVRKLDLSSMASVRKFCTTILQEELQLDILVNNAGLALTEKLITEDGFETHVAVNHLNPFLLTNILIGLMKDSDEARIINISSSAHLMAGRVDLENINSEKSWDGSSIYGRTKLFNIFFTFELHRRLADAGLSNTITANCLHPGVIGTELFRYTKQKTIYKYIINAFSVFFKSPWEGAQTTIQLAVSEELTGISGLYFAECKNKLTSKLAEDKELAKQLWEISAKMVKLQPHENHLINLK